MIPGSEPTLVLREGGQIIFQSASRWLHPLFELEEFFDSPTGTPAAGRLNQAPEHFVLQDTVIGRAGAFLIDRLGIIRVEIGLISRLATAWLDARGIHWTAQTVVDRIACMTEDLLADQNDPAEVYRLLKERRAAALARLSPQTPLSSL